jgi:hypothetical protein
VDAIMEYRWASENVEFRVRWVGYSSAEDTWVREGVLDCPDLVSTFLSSTPLIGTPRALQAAIVSASDVQASCLK